MRTILQHLERLRRNVVAQIVSVVGIASAFVTFGNYWPYAVLLVVAVLVLASIPWLYERITGVSVSINAAENGRRLKDWQIGRLKATLANYPAQKVVILVAEGAETAQYAEQFRRIFKQSKWDVRTEKAPTKQPIIDLQVSVNSRYFVSGPPQWMQAFRGVIDLVGIKCRPLFIMDPDVGPDVLALWVGPESPPQINPSNYPPLGVGRPIV